MNFYRLFLILIPCFLNQSCLNSEGVVSKGCEGDANAEKECKARSIVYIGITSIDVLQQSGTQISFEIKTSKMHRNFELKSCSCGFTDSLMAPVDAKDLKFEGSLSEYLSNPAPAYHPSNEVKNFGDEKAPLNFSVRNTANYLTVSIKVKDGSAKESVAPFFEIFVRERQGDSQSLFKKETPSSDKKSPYDLP